VRLSCYGAGLTGRQVGSFDSAKSSVVPVPPAPHRPAGWQVIVSPTVLPTYEQKLAKHNAAVQHNVDAVAGYEGASSYNGDNLPASYGSITPDSAGVGIRRLAVRPEPGPNVEWRDTRNPGGGPRKESASGPESGGHAADESVPAPVGGLGGAPPRRRRVDSRRRRVRRVWVVSRKSVFRRRVGLTLMRLPGLVRA
jgi:hypothetical protein